MDELWGPLIGFFLALVVVGFIGTGIDWAFSHHPTLSTMVLLLIVAVVAAFLRRRYMISRGRIREIEDRTEALRALERPVTRAVVQLSGKRQELEREKKKVAELRGAYRGELNFHILANKHHESRLLADACYDTMKSSVLSRDALAGEVVSFREHLAGISRSNSRDTNSRRMRRHIESANSVVDTMRQAIEVFRVEVSSLRQVLESYNDQTRELKQHIRANCGTRGMRWYNELEERTKNRSI